MNCSYIVSVSNLRFHQHNISLAKKNKSGYIARGSAEKNICSSSDAVISSFSHIKIFGVNNFLQK